MTDLAALRRNMVDTQLRTYDVNSKRLLDAVEAVGREHYIPGHDTALAYADKALTIRAAAETRSLLQPMVLARMIQAAEIAPPKVVLSVAGGTGYAAALMNALGASVTLLEAGEQMAALARRSLLADGVSTVAVVSGDLSSGPADGCSYDIILIEGGIDAEPTTLLERLTDGGRLVAVLGRGRSGRVVVFQRSGSVIGKRSVFDATATSLSAFQPAPAFEF